MKRCVSDDLEYEAAVGRSGSKRTLAIGMLFWLMSWPALPDAPSSGDCSQAMGADALARCGSKLQESEDARLDDTYALIMKIYDAGSVDPTHPLFDDARQNLATAQTAWKTLREAQCAAEVSISGPVSASGSVMIFGTCELTLTRERIRYLENLVAELSPHSRLCKTTPNLCRAHGAQVLPR
jgi:uncharacterized protein YecT (DUF1311 family)